MKHIALAAIRMYQRFVSPLLPSNCRYAPTCSHYATDAIGRYGAFHGVLLAVSRLARCHPLGGKGYDPVP